jgi:hypothetical protein
LFWLLNVNHEPSKQKYKFSYFTFVQHSACDSVSFPPFSVSLLYTALLKVGYFHITLNNKNGKVKVIPLQAYGAQRVLGRLRLPDSVASALEGGRLSAIRIGRLYPQEYPGTHFKRLSRPWAHGIIRCHGKNPQ